MAKKNTIIKSHFSMPTSITLTLTDGVDVYKRQNLGIWESPWVGFAQFEKFFSSHMFKRVIKNTLVVSIYGLIAGFPMPIILALVLNSLKSERYKRFAQTVTYLPYFISTVVLVGILNQVLNPRIGLMANFLMMAGVTEVPNILGSPSAFPHLYVWSGIWQSMGYLSLIHISTHTLRKTFSYWSLKLNSGDAEALYTLQSALNHSDTRNTLK